MFQIGHPAHDVDRHLMPRQVPGQQHQRRSTDSLAKEHRTPVLWLWKSFVTW